MLRRKIGFFAVVVAVLFALFWELRLSPRPVETAIAKRGPLSATVGADGRTRIRDVYVVTAPVDGDIERIVLKEGDSVSVGTTLAHIRPVAPRPLDERSRAEAIAAVSAARSTVTQAEANEKEAAAALTHAESELDTTRKLVNQQVSPPNNLEHAEHQAQIRRQAVEAARAAAAASRAELERAEALIASNPNKSGQPVILVHSPIRGRVLRVVRASSGPVAIGAPLVEIGNTTAIEITTDLLTADAMAVPPDASAFVREWGGSPLAAKVRRIEPAAFTKISSLGLEEQRVRVILDLVDSAPPGLGHDFHVSVAIVVWEGQNVLSIPSTALFRSGDQWAVFTIHDGRAHLRTIQPGKSDTANTVVERGLDEGEEVVTQPSDLLRDGMRVKPIVHPPLEGKL